MQRLQIGVMRIFFSISFLFLISIFLPSFAYADPPDSLDPHEVYIRAKVLQVVSEGLQNFQDVKTYNEIVQVQFLEGREKGKRAMIGYSLDATFGVQGKIGKGATVVVDSKPDTTGKMYYSIYEPYRLTSLWWILGAFALLILVVVGKKGIGAVIGLAISLLIIMLYIIPQILAGRDPLTICISGAIVILFGTTYIAHGISLKTTVALISTAFSLIIAAFLSFLVVQLTYILGIADQNSYVLQLWTKHLINAQGLFLGGIIIGTLGALNDITTTQSITVFTLAKESPKQHFSHLYWKALHIGREHIISMINTLVLAYAGSSIALFLFFAFNPANLPWWLLLNDQATMEEVIRAVVGSAALLFAVPITTLLASWVSLNRKRIFDRITNRRFPFS
ncbi:MAG TPA: YibE/F family protein [Candidatus Sulfotelmatobacter sp.]|nr:YibE/F family protein [Candidatus Sulfotelmatobacter sp.]